MNLINVGDTVIVRRDTKADWYDFGISEQDWISADGNKYVVAHIANGSVVLLNAPYCRTSPNTSMSMYSGSIVNQYQWWWPLEALEATNIHPVDLY